MIKKGGFSSVKSKLNRGRENKIYIGIIITLGVLFGVFLRLNHGCMMTVPSHKRHIMNLSMA